MFQSSERFQCEAHLRTQQLAGAAPTWARDMASMDLTSSSEKKSRMNVPSAGRDTQWSRTRALETLFAPVPPASSADIAGLRSPTTPGKPGPVCKQQLNPDCSRTCQQLLQMQSHASLDMPNAVSRQPGHDSLDMSASHNMLRQQGSCLDTQSSPGENRKRSASRAVFDPSVCRAPASPPGTCGLAAGAAPARAVVPF